MTDWNVNPHKLMAPPDYGHYLAVFEGHAFDYVPGPCYQASSSVGSTFPTSTYPMRQPSSATSANAPVLATGTATAGVNCRLDFAQTFEQVVQGKAGQVIQPCISIAFEQFRLPWGERHLSN